MQPDTVLTLGDFAFGRYEVPERIPFGGEQALAVHQLVGGARVVDAMGRQDAPIAWSGLFYGESALVRAMNVDALRIGGAAQRLRWSGFDFSVVVQSFSAEFERYYQIPYRISCMVVQDNFRPITAIQPGGIDDFISQDAAAANALVAGVGDSSLTSAMATLNTAISAVSSFATAAQSTINSVLQPMAAVKARTAILIASVNNTVSNVTTVGGVLPNNPVAKSAAGMLAQVNAMTQLPSLLNLNNVLGRMSTNLGTITSGASTVTQAGGNLYALASQKFGDAMAWTGIAKANKLTDPNLTGINTLVVPKASDNSGGVLGA